MIINTPKKLSVCIRRNQVFAETSMSTYNQSMDNSNDSFDLYFKKCTCCKKTKNAYVFSTLKNGVTLHKHCKLCVMRRKIAHYKRKYDRAVNDYNEFDEIGLFFH